VKVAFIVLPLALVGCVDVQDDGSPWQDASSVDGVKVGPAPTLRAAPGCTLRIASWNVHKLPDPSELTAAVLATQEISRADVILMQESSGYAAEAQPRTAMVADALSMTWAHQPIRDLGDGGMQANGIISRYPLDRVMVRSRPTSSSATSACASSAFTWTFASASPIAFANSIPQRRTSTKTRSSAATSIPRRGSGSTASFPSPRPKPCSA
jgi:hypothetical protein